MPKGVISTSIGDTGKTLKFLELVVEGLEKHTKCDSFRLRYVSQYRTLEKEHVLLSNLLPQSCHIGKYYWNGERDVREYGRHPGTRVLGTRVLGSPNPVPGSHAYAFPDAWKLSNVSDCCLSVNSSSRTKLLNGPNSAKKLQNHIP